jgi:hypothetical protein
MSRPIDSRVLAQNADNLTIAQQLAKAGKLSDGSLNPAIYGDMTIAFDPFKEIEMQNFDMLEENQFEATSLPLQQAPEETPASVSPETEEAEEKPLSPEEKLRQIATAMKEMLPNAPSFETLTKWKSMHGDIYLLNIEEKIYIFRYIKRQEWLQLRAQESWNKMSQDQQEDHVFDRCLLFPRLDPVAKAGLPAGIVGLIAEQIRFQSMFLDPVQVANTTIKL